jgi:mono/diheme cytochrome c family protein
LTRLISLLLIANAALLGAAFAQSASNNEWRAPAKAAARKNPLHGKPELAAGGKKVFVNTCSVCHDSGDKQVGPHLALAPTQQQTDGELFWKISNGNSRTGMPAFSSLPEGQRWQLVLSIRSLADSSPRQPLQ